MSEKSSEKQFVPVSNVEKNIYDGYYQIDQFNYHYDWELSQYMGHMYLKGWRVVQIIGTTSNPDPKKMHRATVLFKAATVL